MTARRLEGGAPYSVSAHFNESSLQLISTGLLEPESRVRSLLREGGGGGQAGGRESEGAA